MTKTNTSATTRAGYVAIAGRPNAGKSTLLNRVLGSQVSIVTPKAQTTRERVHGILTENGKQIVFIDTPGIHNARPGGINASMMHEVREALDTPSCIWYLVDPSSKPKFEEPVFSLLAKSKAPVIVVLNKCDLRFATPEFLKELGDGIIAAAKEKWVNVSSIVTISASMGLGIEELMTKTWEFIPESPFYYPDEEQLSDRPTRFFVAEKVREQLLMQLGEELPYSCAVEIERFDESAALPRIEAVIHVERDSQKGMVVGAGGQKIKAIGQAARLKVEEFMGQKVFLGLKVKLLKDWTRDAQALKRLGYNLPAPPKPQGKKKSFKTPRPDQAPELKTDHDRSSA